MEYAKVYVSKELKKRLDALKHKGQSLGGVIEELLDKKASPSAGSVEAVRCRLYPLPDGTWSDEPPANWSKKEAK